MYYIGIDLGGTNIAVGITDENGKIIKKDSVPTLKEREYPEIIKDMAMLSLKVIKDAGIDIKEVRSIGVGAPGSPDSKNGIIIYANNIKFRNVPVRAEIQKYINLDVYVDNDANCAALAESIAGASKGVKDSVAITIGTGLGGGVVIDGKIYSGFNNSAAELGHMVIVADGVKCTCGRRGCWESYASATAIIEQTKEAAKANPKSLINKLVDGKLENIDAKVAFDAARQGDETGIKVVDKFIEYLAIGIANVINIFQPEILVIGGGVCKEGEYLLKPLRELVSSYTYTREEIKQTEIKAATMGNDAGIVGAAMLGLQK